MARTSSPSSSRSSSSGRSSSGGRSSRTTKSNGTTVTTRSTDVALPARSAALDFLLWSAGARPRNVVSLRRYDITEEGEYSTARHGKGRDNTYCHKRVQWGIVQTPAEASFWESWYYGDYGVEDSEDEGSSITVSTTHKAKSRRGRRGGGRRNGGGRSKKASRRDDSSDEESGDEEDSEDGHSNYGGFVPMPGPPMGRPMGGPPMGGPPFHPQGGQFRGPPPPGPPRGPPPPAQDEEPAFYKL